jgi:hypothetical protein
LKAPKFCFSSDLSGMNFLRHLSGPALSRVNHTCYFDHNLLNRTFKHNFFV